MADRNYPEPCVRRPHDWQPINDVEDQCTRCKWKRDRPGVTPTPITDRQNPVLAQLHDAVSIEMGMLTRQQAWERKCCLRCQKPVDPEKDFRDTESYREYYIMAMCQICQDQLWGAFEEEEEEEE